MACQSVTRFVPSVVAGRHSDGRYSLYGVLGLVASPAAALRPAAARLLLRSGFYGTAKAVPFHPSSKDRSLGTPNADFEGQSFRFAVGCAPALRLRSGQALRQRGCSFGAAFMARLKPRALPPVEQTARWGHRTRTSQDSRVASPSAAFRLFDYAQGRLCGSEVAPSEQLTYGTAKAVPFHPSSRDHSQGTPNALRSG